MVTISRPINGISLNGDEFLLDDNGKPRVFDDKLMLERSSYPRDSTLRITGITRKSQMNSYKLEPCPFCKGNIVFHEYFDEGVNLYPHDGSLNLDVYKGSPVRSVHFACILCGWVSADMADRNCKDHYVNIKQAIQKINRRPVQHEMEGLLMRAQAAMQKNIARRAYKDEVVLCASISEIMEFFDPPEEEE